ncbi:Hypothetical protein R9X50_00032300 [Acrodontium crateriforme]|uniref:Uncharacterized protein n=1 Tax=Acrodontium crateriforme TaxID=150365 RepID=A0AAQ3LXV4_9PEZI|nr:Hypothetical protein R9X50_00032300 [Acrodontium crateriforme]
MRSLFTFAAVLSVLAPVLALPIPLEARSMYTPSLEHDMAVDSYSGPTDTDSVTTTINIPRPDDDALVFEIHVPIQGNLGKDDHLSINHHPIHLLWDNDRTESKITIPVTDVASVVHTADISIRGVASRHTSQDTGSELLVRNTYFDIISLDGQPANELSFELVTQPGSSSPLQMVTVGSSNDLIDLTEPDVPTNPFTDDSKDETFDHKEFDLSQQADLLRLLEIEATALQAEIIAKKKAITAYLKQHRSGKSLRVLIKECDGLVCAAQAAAQRICDTISDQSSGYAKTGNFHVQQLVAVNSDEKSSQSLSMPLPQMQNLTSGTVQDGETPLKKTQSVSASAYKFQDLVDPTNPLILALQIIAAALGLATLFKVIQRKCMSMRKRVERAADAEERRNARAYRRAARRALMRQRWDNFISALNCFRPKAEDRIEDYEEKRALILQDAFLEQMNDIDSAEKGQIMEAEIRELRNAQEIVASLIRYPASDRHFGTDLESARPVYLPSAMRSRASTGTLPSYTSESLPGYTSRPATLAASSIVDILTTSTPSTLASNSSSISGDDDSDSYVSPPSTTSSAGGQRTISLEISRCTPVSSIIDVSPRPSDETLRTLISRSTDMAGYR